MNQEDKELLLKDISGRLPYGVKVQYLTESDKIYICNVDQVSIKSQCVSIAEIEHTVFTWRTIDRIKPYLRPMSSMTEEEKKEFYTFQYKFTLQTHEYRELDKEIFSEYSDWLNKKMFDYRGLIPMGLALEASKDIYKEE